MRVALMICLMLPGSWTALGEGLGQPPRTQVSRFSEVTLVLCNPSVEGSKELAVYYAKARGIPSDHILEVDCPDSEAITRDQYRYYLEKPLREKLLDEGWWLPRRDPDTGQQTLRSQYHVMVLTRGMPLKIVPGETEPAGEARKRRTAASVDSELATLGRPGSVLEGPLTNPYYRSLKRFDEAQVAIQLVGRIDGPTVAICQAMIDGAIEAEQTGLWGQAYVDVGGPFELGDTWLRGAADTLRAKGFPVTVSGFGEPFPPKYPMRDPAVYLGWFEERPGGPFQRDTLRFRPGAVACHLHFESAVRVRQGENTWAMELLEHGAAAVLGSVYEPFMELSHELDTFTDRLSRGFTFAESAYASLRGISWMGVALGDPLYQPFREPGTAPDRDRYGFDEMQPYKILRAAYARWGKGNPLPDRELFNKLVLASAKSPSPILLEHQALAALEQEDYEEAYTQFLRAQIAYGERVDKLRMDLHLGDLERRRGDRLDTFRAYRKAAQDYADLPEGEAAAKMLEALQE